MDPLDPRLSIPAERGRSAAKDKATRGQYVAVCSVSNSPLTNNPFLTVSQPFRIKCERYIFLKKCVRSSLLLILLPHVYVSWLWLYNITHICYFVASNKSWRQHPTRHQLYGHLPPITKTIQVRRTRLAGHCWRSKDELISDVLLWTPTYGQAKAGRPARTYVQQLCEDAGCSPEDLPKAMNDREKWRERVRDIRAGGTTWWWWWFLLTSHF